MCAPAARWRGAQSSPGRALARRSFVGRVLLLRRVEYDVERLLFFVDLECLAVGLVALRDYLDKNLALRNRWNLCLPVLVGAQFEGSAHSLPELDDGVPLNEPHHYAG